MMTEDTGPESGRWTATVNGQAVQLTVAPTRRLIDILREDLGLTGTKWACEIGRCGACAVLLDGYLVNACLTLAYQAEGRSVQTIEGLGQGEPTAVQEAFLTEGAFQCGYCTAGMVMAVTALLAAPGPLSDEQIREGLAGNLCRCTGYAAIVRAVRRAERRAKVT